MNSPPEGAVSLQMPDAPKGCSRCGSPLGRDVGAGVCAACLIEDALATAETTELTPTAPVATGQSPDDGAPLVQRVGEYELLEEIGRGGMGVIYKARQAGLDRLVAVKMLLAGEFADAKARQRFLREARIAARLTHPGIVTLHEVGEYQGRPYFAMEFVPGPNLAQLCRGDLLPVKTAARYVEHLARAVHFAHQHGVIHRDLKPANILISPDDEPKLTDFGLTKSLVDSTRTVESAGSPNFMAPEQADPTFGPTGTATDIFGLGAVLYFLLTGRPPVMGESLTETLRAVVTCEPVAPGKLRPALPRDLETIVMRCLEREPSRRYASALEVAEELARWRNREPIRARPASAVERLGKWIRRRPVVALLGTACALAVLAGFAGIIWQWRRAEVERARAEDAVLWRIIPAPTNLEFVGVEIADMNHDGRPDLLVALTEDGAAVVYLGQPGGEFTLAPGSPFRAPNSRLGPDHDGALAVHDFDEDGQLDIVLVNETSSSLSLLRGDGSGGFAPDGVPIKVGRQPRQLITADLNGDRHRDLVVANYGDGSVTILLGDGKGRFREADASSVATGPAPWGLAVADFNNDRLLDLAVSNSGTNTVSLYLNGGGGRFGEAPGSPYAVGKESVTSRESSPFDITAADMNEDGVVDLVSADTRSHSVTLLFGNGRGGFVRTPGSVVMVGAVFPRRILAADFNGDHHLDLATANESGSVSVLAGDGKGGIQPFPVSPIFEPGFAHSLAAGDLDGDGRLDLVTCGPYFGLALTRNRVLLRNSHWAGRPSSAE